MNHPTACPSSAAIRRFLGGHYTGSEADLVAEHLIGCEACREAAVAMSSPSAVVEAIRSWSMRPRGEAVDDGGLRTGTPPAASHPVTVRPAGPGASGVGSGLGSAAAGVSGLRESRFDTGPTRLDDRCVLEPAVEPEELGRLGPYRVLELLGEGGMGLVYRALDTRLQRPVALKVMRPSVAQSAAARSRFDREARAIAAIEHDNIVTIYQVGEANGLPYLAMPLLQGETLDKRLRAVKRLPVREALRIARQIAEGLEAAHARGLVHRDIKPGNIWLETSKGRVKILDFGLAQETGGEQELTQTGIIIGTPAYMAPEQAANEPVDARTDLFSLGSVLYRMLTGVPPFQGSNSLAIIRSLAVAQPKPPHELVPEIPLAVSRLVLRLLAKDPEGRPQTAQEVVSELAKLEREVAGLNQVADSPAMSAIQRALLDEIGLAEDGTDVQVPALKSTAPGVVPASRSAVGPAPPSPSGGSSGIAPRPAGASGIRGEGQTGRSGAAGDSTVPRSRSGMPAERGPNRFERAGSAAVEPDVLLRGIDTSFLDEESNLPSSLLEEDDRKRPRRPIPWPLVLSLGLLLFMATLALLIVLNRKG